MIRHIVLFQLKEFNSTEEKLAKLQQIKHDLEALVGVVPTLKSMEVHLNTNPAEKFDFMLSSDFESLEALEAYAVHPAHEAVAVTIRAVAAGRACVDYQF
ncbi:MAG: Dabb family protein [Bacteroidales bacterium]